MKEQTTHRCVLFSLIFASIALSGVSSNLTAADRWLIKAGGSGNDGATGVTRASNGDVFITGSVGPTASFETIQITNDLGNAFFLARYNTSGELLWVTNASGASASRGGTIYADGAGNAYVAAWHTNALNLGNGVVVPLTDTQPGPWARFLACYSPGSAALWAVLSESIGAPVVQDPLGRVLAGHSTETYLDDSTRIPFLVC
jgi:hypothetical protein